MALDWFHIDSAPKDRHIVLGWYYTGDDGVELFCSTTGQWQQHIDALGAGWTDGSVADWGYQYNCRLNPVCWREPDEEPNVIWMHP